MIDRDLVADCVHCGFCLPTCPTYGPLWQEEMDSPRGRIYLMAGLVEGTLPLSETVVEHFDRCLGCMACVTACPSGVQYDKLIGQTRALIEEEYERPLSERVLRAGIFSVFPHPRRLRLALALAPLGRALPLPRFLRPLVDLAPPWRSSERPPELTSARGSTQARVGLLLGCVQRVVFGGVNAATARVLAAYGCEVAAPAGQACCGALALHAGRREEGLERARRTIDAFEAAGVDLVVSNAAGCGSSLRDYGHLLAGDPAYAERAEAFSRRVRDVSQIVADRSRALAEEAPTGDGLRAPALAPLPLRAAFQDSCHLYHAQGVRDAPRALLRSVPGIEVLEPAEQEICCGSAGIYNLVEPGPARELGDRKALRVLETEPEAYVSANPGCLVQVTAALRRAGRPLPAFHPVELLDASLRGLALERLLASARR